MAFSNVSVQRLWLALNNDNYKPLCTLLDELVGGAASDAIPVFGALVKTAVALANSPVYANGTAGLGATLTSTGNHAIGTVGGVAITVVGSVILVTEQVAQEQNGLYEVTVVGGAVPYVLTRLPGFDIAAKIKDGSIVGVQQGTYAGLVYVEDATVTTVGTDPITFALAATSISESSVRTAAAAFTAAFAINGQAITNVASITAKSTTTLTIAGGIVTATQSIHAIDTEAAAASDDLDTISGMVLGNWYRFKIVNAGRNVVFKHGTGNLLCWQNHDITLDVTADSALVLYDGTNGLVFPGGLATVPKTVLTSDVVGILPVANGGTGLSAAPAQAGFVMYAAPPANEATAGASTLVTDVAISAVALTLAAQPTYPCKLNIYKTDGDSSYAATLTIIGKGPAGEAVTEAVTLIAVDGTHTYVTSNAFASITSATVSALSGETGADKIAIGQKSALGLPIPSGATSVVVYKEGVAATSAAAPANETVGTVDATARTVIPTTAPDGAKAFSFWFSFAY